MYLNKGCHTAFLKGPGSSECFPLLRLIDIKTSSCDNFQNFCDSSQTAFCGTTT